MDDHAHEHRRVNVMREAPVVYRSINAFDQAIELVNLVLAIAAINVCNRIAVSSHMVFPEPAS